MYHPLLLQPEVLSELPALLEDKRAQIDEPAVLSYRSEAFAEDLSSTHEVPCVGSTLPPGGGRMKRLVAMPLGALLAGARAVFGRA